LLELLELLALQVVSLLRGAFQRCGLGLNL
jgi:hypothetical protein